MKNDMSTTTQELFTQLHRQKTPLLLGNAWDAHSARLFEKNGYRAIGTTSAGLAHALGRQDGEDISFNDLLFVVKHIIAAVNVPVSVDMEKGYAATTADVIKNIELLCELGVAGINIEDSIIRENKKEILPVELFAKKIHAIKTHLLKSNLSLFVNARTDAFLLRAPNPLATTLERATAYETAGADGLFVPFVVAKDDIAAITTATTLLVNVLCMPGLPSFETLTALGVRRISIGTSMSDAVYNHMEKLAAAVQTNKSFDVLF
jgi:2-methylisocitrate lyase-like PEP mutase family enzyme